MCVCAHTHPITDAHTPGAAALFVAVGLPASPLDYTRLSGRGCWSGAHVAAAQTRPRVVDARRMGRHAALGRAGRRGGMARTQVLAVAAVTVATCLGAAAAGAAAGGESTAPAPAGAVAPAGWSSGRWVVAAVARARRAGSWAAARVVTVASRQVPTDAPPNPSTAGDAAAADEAAPTVLLNTATLQPVPPMVPLKSSLLFVNLFVDGTNFTDSTNERIIGCSATMKESGVGVDAWQLVNATRFTDTLLQAIYAVVVPDARTGGFSLRWVDYVRSGALAGCADLPDGSAAASVAPFDTRASVATPARSFGVWVPALVIGLAAGAAVLAVAAYALVHLGRHYEKTELADPDAPGFAAVDEARDVERAGSDADDDSGYDSEEEILPVGGGAGSGGSGGGGAAAVPAGAAEGAR